MPLTLSPPPKPKRAPAFAVTSLPMKTFTVEAYHKLVESGALTTADRMELLNGLLVYKMPQNIPHAGTALALEEILWRTLPPGFIPWCQKPLTIAGSQSEPEPDLAIVRGPRTRYATRKPVPADVVVVVEVSDTTLALDSGEKKETYAAAGIPVYWLVNLVDRRVEVYTSPKAGKKPDYRGATHYGPGQFVPLEIAGGPVAPIAVDDLLAPVTKRGK